MENKSFIRGAAILAAAGIVVQVLGAVFRIPLTNIIGDEGIGYYQTAYPIYIFLLVFSTNGAPAAISKMVSERLVLGCSSEARRVFKCAFILMGAIGLVAASIFFFGARPIAIALKNEGAYECLIAMAPALLLVPIMAVFRGYFQGRREMEPTAFSQFAEQAVRVAVGLTAAYMLMPKGVQTAAAGACVGTSVGPVFGIIVLIIIYMKKKKTLDAECESEQITEIPEGSEISGGFSYSSIIKALAWISIPVTLGVSILPIMNLGDVMIVMRRLQEMGFSESDATALYGQLSGMAGSVINIPQALALSIALSLVPSVAAANSVHDKDTLSKNIGLGLRTSVIIGVPCSIGLFILSKPIILLLFPTQATTIASSGSCLAVLAIGVVFLSAALSMSGILQGLNVPGTAVATLVIAFIVKLISTYILTGIESLNVVGAAWGSTIAYIVIGVLNVMAVKKKTGFKFDFMLTVVKPVVAGIIMGICVALVYYLFNGFIGNSLSTILAVGTGGIAYILSFFKLKGITEEEMLSIPVGRKLHKILKKVHLM